MISFKFSDDTIECVHQTHGVIARCNDRKMDWVLVKRPDCMFESVCLKYIEEIYYAMMAVWVQNYD